MNKVSIRFFDDREVRAIWDEENNQLVSATTQLKLVASDGKKYKSDVLYYENIIALGKTFPSTKYSV